MKGAPIIPEIGQRCVVIDDLRLRFFIGVHEHEFIRWGVDFYQRAAISEEVMKIVKMACFQFIPCSMRLPASV